MNEAGMTETIKPSWWAIWGVASAVALVASWTFLVVIVVTAIVVVGIDADRFKDLESMSESQLTNEFEDFVKEGLGVLVAVGGITFLTIWVAMSLLYKLLVSALLHQSVGFGVCIGAAIAGYAAGCIGWGVDLMAGGVTLGLFGAAANGALAATILRAAARPRGGG